MVGSWREAPARSSDALTEFRCCASTLHSAFETVEIAGSARCAGNKHVVEVMNEPISLAVFPACAVKTGGSLHSVHGRKFALQTMCVAVKQKTLTKVTPKLNMLH